jgi:hypothetical protein
MAKAPHAGLAEYTGDRAAGETYFARALELHDELPMPLARAQTLTDYGAFVARGGEKAKARALLAEALHIAEACGRVGTPTVPGLNGGERAGAPGPASLTSSAPRRWSSPSLPKLVTPTGKSPNSSTCPSRRWKLISATSIKNSVSAAAPTRRTGHQHRIRVWGGECCTIPLFVSYL